MNRWIAWARNSAALWVGGVWAQGAWAQTIGGVAYVPPAIESVPTLSEWGIMGASVLLTALAYRSMRTHGRGVARMWAAGLLACAALSSAPWGGSAHAGLNSEVALDQPAGGTADIPYDSDLDFGDFFHKYAVRNTSGRPQRITQLMLISRHSALDADPNEKKCETGVSLAAGEVCYLIVSKDSSGRQ